MIQSKPDLVGLGGGGSKLFDAFSKSDLPTVQALIQSKPDLVSLGGGSEMFIAFSKADLPTVQALIQSKPDLVSLVYFNTWASGLSKYLGPGMGNYKTLDCHSFDLGLTLKYRHVAR